MGLATYVLTLRDSGYERTNNIRWSTTQHVSSPGRPHERSAGTRRTGYGFLARVSVVSI
jgi:hypothetical protein